MGLPSSSDELMLSAHVSLAPAICNTPTFDSCLLSNARALGIDVVESLNEAPRLLRSGFSCGPGDFAAMDSDSFSWQGDSPLMPSHCTLNAVCTTPRGHRDLFEASAGAAFKPCTSPTGSPRLDRPSPWSFGFLPQTSALSDRQAAQDFSILSLRNCPLPVIDVSADLEIFQGKEGDRKLTAPADVGEVYEVLPITALAVVDPDASKLLTWHVVIVSKEAAMRLWEVEGDALNSNRVPPRGPPTLSPMSRGLGSILATVHLLKDLGLAEEWLQGVVTRVSTWFSCQREAATQGSRFNPSHSHSHSQHHSIKVAPAVWGHPSTRRTTAEIISDAHSSWKLLFSRSHCSGWCCSPFAKSQLSPHTCPAAEADGDVDDTDASSGGNNSFTPYPSSHGLPPSSTSWSREHGLSIRSSSLTSSTPPPQGAPKSSFARPRSSSDRPRACEPQPSVTGPAQRKQPWLTISVEREMPRDSGPRSCVPRIPSTSGNATTSTNASSRDVPPGYSARPPASPRTGLQSAVPPSSSSTSSSSTFPSSGSASNAPRRRLSMSVDPSASSGRGGGSSTINGGDGNGEGDGSVFSFVSPPIPTAAVPPSGLRSPESRSQATRNRQLLRRWSGSQVHGPEDERVRGGDRQGGGGKEVVPAGSAAVVGSGTASGSMRGMGDRMPAGTGVRGRYNLMSPVGQHRRPQSQSHIEISGASMSAKFSTSPTAMATVTLLASAAVAGGVGGGGGGGTLSPQTSSRRSPAHRVHHHPAQSWSGGSFQARAGGRPVQQTQSGAAGNPKAAPSASASAGGAGGAVQGSAAGGSPGSKPLFQKWKHERSLSGHAIEICPPEETLDAAAAVPVSVGERGGGGSVGVGGGDALSAGPLSARVSGRTTPTRRRTVSNIGDLSLGRSSVSGAVRGAESTGADVADGVDGQRRLQHHRSMTVEGQPMNSGTITVVQGQGSSRRIVSAVNSGARSSSSNVNRIPGDAGKSGAAVTSARVALEQTKVRLGVGASNSDNLTAGTKFFSPRSVLSRDISVTTSSLQTSTPSRAANSSPRLPLSPSTPSPTPLHVPALSELTARSLSDSPRVRAPPATALAAFSVTSPKYLNATASAAGSNSTAIATTSAAAAPSSPAAASPAPIPPTIHRALTSPEDASTSAHPVGPSLAPTQPVMQYGVSPSRLAVNRAPGRLARTFSASYTPNPSPPSSASPSFPSVAYSPINRIRTTSFSTLPPVAPPPLISSRSITSSNAQTIYASSSSASTSSRRVLTKGVTLADYRMEEQRVAAMQRQVLIHNSPARKKMMTRSSSLREYDGGGVSAPSLPASTSLTSVVAVRSEDAGARALITRVLSSATLPSDDECSVIFHPDRDEEDDAEGSRCGRSQGVLFPDRLTNQSTGGNMEWAHNQSVEKSKAWDLDGVLQSEQKGGESESGKHGVQKHLQLKQQQWIGGEQQQQHQQKQLFQQPQSQLQSNAQPKYQKQLLAVQVPRPSAVASLKVVPQSSPQGSEVANPPSASVTPTAGTPLRRSPKSPAAMPTILMRRSTGGKEGTGRSPGFMPRLSPTGRWNTKDRQAYQSDTPRPFDLVMSNDQKMLQDEVLRRKDELLAIVQKKEQLLQGDM